MTGCRAPHTTTGFGVWSALGLRRLVGPTLEERRRPFGLGGSSAEAPPYPIRCARGPDYGPAERPLGCSWPAFALETGEVWVVCSLSAAPPTRVGWSLVISDRTGPRAHLNQAPFRGRSVAEVRGCWLWSSPPFTRVRIAVLRSRKGDVSHRARDASTARRQALGFGRCSSHHPSFRTLQ